MEGRVKDPEVIRQRAMTALQGRNLGPCFSIYNGSPLKDFKEEVELSILHFQRPFRG